MKRTAFALGLVALFASTSASAIKVPTGNTDYDLNVSVLLQGRYEGTFEATTRKTLDSDFFIRRGRIAVGGTAFKVFSFFAQYDNSNLGKRGTSTSVGTATNPGFVQDAIIGFTPIPDFTIEGGLILEPSLRTLAYNSSGGQVQVEAPTDLIFDNLSRGFRMGGVQLRGFLGPAHLIHYRAGVYEGVHNANVTGTGAAATPAVNTGGKPLVGGHVRVNILGDETGYGLNQMYLDGKPRASIGGAIQYQPKAACTGTPTVAAGVTNCSIATGAGATAEVNDYKMFGGDAFIDLPIGPTMEFAASAAVVRWDWGSTNAPANAVGYQRTGTGYTGEVDLRIGGIAPYAAFYQYAADSGTSNKTADRRKYAAGLCFFLKGHQSKVNVEWNNITPGQPGNPGAIAPVTTNATGLKGPATNAIWVQAQAAF
ncbi:MAG: hypothetical protein ACJ79O_15915 [Myxococcales bacterium]